MREKITRIQCEESFSGKQYIEYVFAAKYPNRMQVWF